MSSTAKLFMHGRSQAVRLPKEFRFEGTECGSARSARLEEYRDIPFMEDGRDQGTILDAEA